MAKFRNVFYVFCHLLYFRTLFREPFFVTGFSEELKRGQAHIGSRNKVNSTLDPPLNFNQVKWSVDVSTQKYSALLSWLPPISNGLSISRYRLSWGRHVSTLSTALMADPQYLLTSEYKTSLPPHRLTFNITELDLNFNYWVKLQVIYVQGRTKLKSGEARIIVTPGMIPELYEQQGLYSHDYHSMHSNNNNNKINPNVTTVISIRSGDEDEHAASYDDKQGEHENDPYDDYEEDAADDDDDDHHDDRLNENSPADVGKRRNNQWRSTIDDWKSQTQTKPTVATNKMAVTTDANRDATHQTSLIFHVTPIPVGSVHFDPPYFHNGLVRCRVTWTLATSEKDETGGWPEKFHVEWFPTNCSSSKSIQRSAYEEDYAVDGGFNKDGNAGDGDDISVISVTTQETSFVMYDLWYECRYHVTIRSVSRLGTLGSKISARVHVPGCDVILIAGDVTPPCRKTETSRAMRKPHIMAPPTHIRHSYVIKGTNITAKLFWDPPVQSNDYHGYVITWFIGGSVEDKNGVMEYVNSTAIERSKHIVYIKDLLESRSYEVRVQTVSRTGLGDAAIVQLHTPRVQNSKSSTFSMNNNDNFHYIYGEADQLNDDYDPKFKFERTNRQHRNRVNGDVATINFMEWPPINRRSESSTISLDILKIALIAAYKNLN